MSNNLYIPNLQFYIEQLSDSFNIEYEVLKEAIHHAALTRPTGEVKENSYNKDPFNTLESDPEFNKRFSKIKTFLDSKAKADFQWLINRAYFVGYQNGGEDGN